MIENDIEPKKGASKEAIPPGQHLKTKLRSRDPCSALLFAVHKLNTSCSFPLAAQK